MLNRWFILSGIRCVPRMLFMDWNNLSSRTWKRLLISPRALDVPVGVKINLIVCCITKTKFSFNLYYPFSHSFIAIRILQTELWMTNVCCDFNKTNICRLCVCHILTLFWEVNTICARIMLEFWIYEVSRSNLALVSLSLRYLVSDTVSLNSYF